MLLSQDEAWNPKMKMSQLEPKKDRPVRDSPKNIAIEKGLKKASENRLVYNSRRFGHEDCRTIGKCSSHAEQDRVGICGRREVREYLVGL